MHREWKVLMGRNHGDVAAELGANLAAWVKVTWLHFVDESAPMLAKRAAAYMNIWREETREEIRVHPEELYNMMRTLVKYRRKSPRDVEVTQRVVYWRKG